MFKNSIHFQHTKTIPIISSVLIILGLSYLIFKCIFSNTDTIDFQFIWLAGNMWLNELNPYSSEYKNLGQALFVNTNVPEYWFYPPNWWSISQLTALFPYETSMKLWRIFSGLLIVFGSMLIIKNYYNDKSTYQQFRTGIFIFFACVMYGTSNTIALGQTSALIYFGFACFISAYLNGNKLLMIAGITLLMLKPHIGIVICAFMLTSKKWAPSIFWAALLTIIISFPAIKLAGLESFIREFTNQIQLHGLHPQNTPQGMTGLRNLLKNFLNLEASVLTFTGLGFMVALSLGWICHIWTKQAVFKKNNSIIYLCLLITVVIFFVPLHSYDLLIISPIIILSSEFNSNLQGYIGIALLAFFRADKLTEMTGFFSENLQPGNFLVSLASLIIFVILIITLYNQLIGSKKVPKYHY